MFIMTKATYDKYYQPRPFASGVRSGDIGLTRYYGGDIGSNIVRDGICNLTNGVVNHAFIIGYKGDLIEAQGKGVVKTDLTEYTGTPQGVLILRPNPAIISDDMKSVLLSYAYSCVGRQYDYIGVIDFLLRKWFGREIPTPKKTDFCSQLDAEAYATIKYPICTGSTADCAPQTILDYEYCNGLLSFTNPIFTLADWQNLNIAAVTDFMHTKYPMYKNSIN